MANDYKIEIDNNIPEVEKEMKKKISEILTEIGLKWQELAVKEITVRKIVDTGSLRRSMNFEVDNASKTVIVGSPLDYATKQEFENKKGPYLKPSIINYRDSYKNIAEEILKK